MPRKPTLRRRRALLPLGAVAALAALVLAVDVGAPHDVGRWAPVALDGMALTAVVAADDRLVVGGPTGALALSADGITDLKVDGRVHHLLVADGAVLAATDHGVLELGEPGAHRMLAAEGSSVETALVHDRTLLAVAGGALVDVADDTEILGADAGVRTALSTSYGLLLGLTDGLGRLTGDGEVERLWDGPRVDLLHEVDDEDGRRLLAAVSADEPLYAAPGPEGPWEPSDDGIRLATVQGLADDPAGAGRVLAGGTGMDDGESGERGGIAESADAGRSWSNERDRLAAVHVYDFATRREPLRAEVGVAGRDPTTIGLPLQRPTVYAGTNGAGLYRRQPELPGAQTAAALAPVGRFLAPAALGALVLWVAWQGFCRLRSRAPAARPMSPSSPSQGGERPVSTSKGPPVSPHA